MCFSIHQPSEKAHVTAARVATWSVGIVARLAVCCERKGWSWRRQRGLSDGWLGCGCDGVRPVPQEA